MAAMSAVTGEPAAEVWWRRPWTRTAVGVGILIAILFAVGAEPFVRGITSVTPAAVVAALALTAVATAAAAWRWRVIAARLGLRLGWRESLAAYYGSQFLNTVLPGGVMGDVHRAVSHGRSVDQVAQAARAVAAERMVGQAVQLLLAFVVLASIGISAYAPAMGLLLVLVGVVGAAAIAAVVSRRVRTMLQREWTILRDALGTVGTIVRVVAASIVVVCAYVAMFVVACVAVGIDAGPERVTAAAVIAVVAASIPLSIGGWGPREGAAAWAFGAAGLGAATGIAAATAFGVLAMIAVAPGAVVVAASVLRRRRGAVAREASMP